MSEDKKDSHSNAIGLDCADWRWELSSQVAAFKEEQLLFEVFPKSGGAPKLRVEGVPPTAKRPEGQVWLPSVF